VTEPVRDHDLVVYGATGFVGVLTAGYLARQAPPDVRIALGGRSQTKLEQTRAELGVDWPLVIADSQDRDAVAALAESARVVATTVGPYFKYGKPLAVRGSRLNQSRRRGFVWPLCAKRKPSSTPSAQTRRHPQWPNAGDLRE
jgi:uncharacterized protein YbjT (DUF2867 family)